MYKIFFNIFSACIYMEIAKKFLKKFPQHFLEFLKLCVYWVSSF